MLSTITQCIFIIVRDFKLNFAYSLGTVEGLGYRADKNVARYLSQISDSFAQAEPTLG